MIYTLKYYGLSFGRDSVLFKVTKVKICLDFKVKKQP